jgi:1-acyl-sn-glycerol-3-phosphate acyltransferase
VWKLRAAVFTAPAIVLATIAMASISLICSLRDREGRTQHRVARLWSRMLLALSFVQCRVSGLEKIDPAANYVFVSNHSSYMDTPVVLGSLPQEFRFFAKKGLFSIPFLGWHLRRAGHLPVVRDEPRAALKLMSDAARTVRERCVSLLLFPEGGRTRENIRPFKEGAAYIAIKAGVPAVPIGIVGSRETLPMGRWLIKPGSIDLRIGDPIPTAGMTTQDRAQLNETLQERVSELTGQTVAVPA